ncbi:MAG: hypothetical protein HYR91_11165, partial [Flavobacteriia bacterium]|nr:hypothetical protein [Flavobacteriia bacterium]
EMVYYSINNCTNGAFVSMGLNELIFKNFELFAVGTNLFKMQQNIEEGSLYFQDGRLATSFKNEPFLITPNVLYILEVKNNGKIYHQKICIEE